MNVHEKKSAMNTNDAPMLEFRLDFGFAHVTFGKKHFNWLYNNPMSFPRKIFATYVPPSFNTCAQTFKPAKINCACIN